MIAIDGPAAAGKSTVASRVATTLNALYFDTGVAYRALTLSALRAGVAPGDSWRLSDMATQLNLAVNPPSIDDGRQYDVLLDGEDVTWDLRTSEVDQSVSQVSGHGSVRDALLDLQREIGRSGKVVMLGRDIGTVVMPDADLKFWLDAPVGVRARRRYEELIERGVEASYDDVLQNMIDRDRADSERSVAPMYPADDAVTIETADRSIDEIVEEIVRVVRQSQPRRVRGELKGE